MVITGQSWDLPFNNNIVTIRYAPDGTELWQRLENGGYHRASGNDVAVDAEGRIYVTGYGFNYTYWEDIITLGYSLDGELLWTQTTRVDGSPGVGLRARRTIPQDARSTLGRAEH